MARLPAHKLNAIVGRVMVPKAFRETLVEHIPYATREHNLTVRRLRCCKPWGESAYVEHGGRERRRITHLVLENPRLLAEPIPCKGLLGLWTPPADVLEALT